MRDSAPAASVRDSVQSEMQTSAEPKAEPAKKRRKVAKSKPKSQDSESLPPKKRKSKVMNKKERDDLLSSLDSIDLDVLKGEVCDKLSEQHFPENLKELANKLSVCERLLNDIIVSQRQCFSGLYKESKKNPEPFLNFQLRWHQYSSAFLLSSQYPLSAIDLQEPTSYQLSETRLAWLHFCEENGAPVPTSNPVMMTVSSAIYHYLLDYIARLQVNAPKQTCRKSTIMDGDDVYYRFGGAALADMLHLRYDQIRVCRDDQRDILSQEISILQAINSRDKTNIPDYLKYRDRGYMYFPDQVFICFLRDLDSAIKEIVNADGLQQEGDNLIKVGV